MITATVAYEMKRKRNAQKRVELRTLANKCLHRHPVTGCECDEPQESLGLCRGHVNSFNYELRSLPKPKREHMRATLAAKGELLEAYEQKRLKRAENNPYVRLHRKLEGAAV